MRGVDGLGRGSGATWSTRSCETEPRVPRYVGCGCRRDVEQHVVAEMGYSKHVLLGARRFTARRQEESYIHITVAADPTAVFGNG